jgi:hypothetical protein
MFITIIIRAQVISLSVKSITVEHVYYPTSPHSLTDGYPQHFPKRFQPLLLPELLNVYGFYVGDVSDDITNFDTSITV